MVHSKKLSYWPDFLCWPVQAFSRQRLRHRSRPRRAWTSPWSWPWQSRLSPESLQILVQEASPLTGDLRSGWCSVWSTAGRRLCLLGRSCRRSQGKRAWTRRPRRGSRAGCGDSWRSRRRRCGSWRELKMFFEFTSNLKLRSFHSGKCCQIKTSLFALQKARLCKFKLS